MTPFELFNWRTVVKIFCLLRIFWVWLINLPLNYQFGTFCHWPLSLWCLASTPAMLMKSLNTLSHKQLLHRECPSGVIKYLWTNIPSTIYDYFLWFVRVDIIRIDVKIGSCFRVVLPINLEILSQLFKHLRLISKTCQYTIVFFYLLLNHNTKEWSAI